MASYRAKVSQISKLKRLRQKARIDNQVEKYIGILMGDSNSRMLIGIGSYLSEATNS